MLIESSQQIIRESLGQLKQPVRLVLFTSDRNCDSCPDALATAQAIKAAAPKIALETYDLTMDRDKSEEYGIKRVPSFVVQSTVATVRHVQRGAGGNIADHAAGRHPRGNGAGA